MSERTIAVVTGTRAEYGLLESPMAEIERRDGLELAVVATGMHLSPQHGHTIDQIRADGYAVTDTVTTLLDSDAEGAMAKSLGIGIMGLAESLRSIDPDVALVLGDRGEAFAGGVAAAHLDVPVAHVHGGEAMQGATIDDSIRHALTKFAHLHFPATEESAERIRRLGEQDWRVTAVGAPGLDDVLAGAFDDPDDVAEALGFDPDRPLIVVVQHPLTTGDASPAGQMRATLDAITNLDAQLLIVYPNADAGGKQMIETIREHSAAGDFTAVENLPRFEYLGLLAAADVLVGNSSSGIIEAPSIDLPVVDVGPRQAGRERGEHVESVPHDEAAIREAVNAALTDEAVQRRAQHSDNPYAFGGAGERIVDRLESVTIDERLLRKEMTY